MIRAGTIARRTFLIGSAAVAGGVAFGIYAYKRKPPNPLLEGLGDGQAALTPYVRVDQSGVTIITPRADVGQGAIVQQGVVLTVEAIEGTDAMIARAGKLRLKGRGGVLVKARKPAQEARIDLPAIGVRTIEHAKAAGLSGIAIEAGGALVIDREGVVEAANAARIFVVGVKVSA